MLTDRIALAVFALGLVATVGGCPGSLDNKDDFLDAGFTSGGMASTGTGTVDPCGDVPVDILAKKCGGAGCHGTQAPQNNLDLESPGVGPRVVGVAATLCVGTLANPSDPASSILYTKLLDSNVCSARMPLARPPLSQKEIDCVKTWIGGLDGAGGAGSSAASSGSAGGT